MLLKSIIALSQSYQCRFCPSPPPPLLALLLSLLSHCWCSRYNHFSVLIYMSLSDQGLFCQAVVVSPLSPFRGWGGGGQEGSALDEYFLNQFIFRGGWVFLLSFSYTCILNNIFVVVISNESLICNIFLINISTRLC